VITSPGVSEPPELRLLLYSENRGATFEAEALGVVPVHLPDVGLGMGEIEVTLDVEACPGCEDARGGEVKVVVTWDHFDAEEAKAKLLRKAEQKKAQVEKRQKADEKKKKDKVNGR
jgi:hypothetical protein